MLRVVWLFSLACRVLCFRLSDRSVTCYRPCWVAGMLLMGVYHFFWCFWEGVVVELAGR